MNAITAAQTLLQTSLNHLTSHSKPSPKDVELALEKAKTATKILNHANGLLEEGIFTVTDEPEEGTPLPFGDPGEITVTFPRKRRQAAGE